MNLAPEAAVPQPALAALLDELESAKLKLRVGKVSDPPESPGLPDIRIEPLCIPPRSPLLPFDSFREKAAEQYRIARTRIARHPAHPSLLSVSSAGPGDGKTVTAINLAASLSLNPANCVLLADADFRRWRELEKEQRSIHRQLGLAPAAGLGELLEDRTALKEALIRAEQFPNLYILPAGNPVRNSAELLDSRGWSDLVIELRQWFRYIVVDSPPVAALADFEPILAVSDGTILVFRPDHTRRSLAAQALRAIPKDKLIGVVMNYVPKWFLANWRA